MARVRDEGGFGLVELLIAMTVMVIGIFAVVAGFSSGLGAVNRASKTTVAGTIADQQMEAFRRGSHAAIVSIAGTTKVGADGRTYWIESVASSKCPDETTPTGTPPTCTLSGGVTSGPVKAVTITVRDGSSTAKVLITESSTFDPATG
jgi:type II secretory pathway pseudopilin PulG